VERQDEKLSGHYAVDFAGLTHTLSRSSNDCAASTQPSRYLNLEPFESFNAFENENPTFPQGIMTRITPTIPHPPEVNMSGTGDWPLNPFVQAYVSLADLDLTLKR
jgi:hypothetical protein